MENKFLSEKFFLLSKEWIISDVSSEKKFRIGGIRSGFSQEDVSWKILQPKFSLAIFSKCHLKATLKYY